MSLCLAFQCDVEVPFRPPLHPHAYTRAHREKEQVPAISDSSLTTPDVVLFCIISSLCSNTGASDKKPGVGLAKNRKRSVEQINTNCTKIIMIY